MSNCSTAFAKRIFPTFMSPQTWRRGSAVLPVGREEVVPLRKARNSALCDGGTREGGGEEGMEGITTDEVGSKGLGVRAEPGSEEANDLSRVGGVDACTSASTGVGSGMDAVMSDTAHGATISFCVVPSGGWDNVAVGGMSCRTVATAPDGGASVGRGIVWAGKAGILAAGLPRELSPILPGAVG
jgi:hypothetical protein